MMTLDRRMQSIGFFVPSAPFPKRFLKSDAERAASRKEHLEQMQANAELRSIALERAKAAANC